MNFVQHVLHFHNKETSMCADGSQSCPEDTVGYCPECDGEVDAEGYTTEECCNYAQWACPVCGNAPCDGSC